MSTNNSHHQFPFEAIRTEPGFIQNVHNSKCPALFFSFCLNTLAIDDTPPSVFCHFRRVRKTDGQTKTRAYPRRSWAKSSQQRYVSQNANTQTPSCPNIIFVQNTPPINKEINKANRDAHSPNVNSNRKTAAAFMMVLADRLGPDRTTRTRTLPRWVAYTLYIPLWPANEKGFQPIRVVHLRDP